MTMDIAQAIASLDPRDDAHWTKDGLPNLNVLKEKVGHRVTRAEAPGPKRPEIVGEEQVEQRRDLPSRKAAPGEVSSYRGAVQLLDDFVVAMDGIPSGRRDPELVVLLNDWASKRPAVLERLSRLEKE